MRTIGLFILLSFLLTSCNYQTSQENASKTAEKAVAKIPVKDGVFIHITESYDNPHRVLMPLKMATIMADDKDVLVYMDIDAVKLVAKGAKDLNYEDFESFQTYVKQLADKNVGIYACPTCLKIAGINPEDLMEGVQVAQKDKFFDFTKGRIITLDY